MSAPSPCAGRMAHVALGVAQGMAWSKYTPHEPPEDPFAPDSESAARRAWLLRWGNRISQGMLLLGFAIILYLLFFQGSDAEAWMRQRWPFR